MKLVSHRFLITGLSPLLLNNPIGIVLDSNPNPNGEISNQKKDYGTPEEQAKKVEYRDSKGNLYIPSIQFRQSLLYACIGKKVGKTSAKKIISASVFNSDDKTTLIDPKSKKPITEWTVDVRPAVVNKGRIARCRPKLESWAAIVRYEIDEDLVPSVKAVEKLQNDAGTLSGVGDYKPANTGPFGRYTCTLIE